MRGASFGAAISAGTKQSAHQPTANWNTLGSRVNRLLVSCLAAGQAAQLKAYQASQLAVKHLRPPVWAAAPNKKLKKNRKPEDDGKEVTRAEKAIRNEKQKKYRALCSDPFAHYASVRAPARTLCPRKTCLF
jgi:hypothetical protein